MEVQFFLRPLMKNIWEEHQKNLQSVYDSVREEQNRQLKSLGVVLTCAITLAIIIIVFVK